MGTVHFFTLYLRRVTSESNPALQSLKVGWRPLIILLFLCFHRFQQACMMISANNGPLNFRLVFFNISGPDPGSQSTCKYIHTLTLKVHSKNRWEQSSKQCAWQSSQLWLEVQQRYLKTKTEIFLSNARCIWLIYVWTRREINCIIKIQLRWARLQYILATKKQRTTPLTGTHVPLTRLKRCSTQPKTWIWR
jgi:hypothetical protein